MKALAGILLLAGALSVLAGGAIAKQVENLHCKQPKCAFNEELGPSQTKTFNGYCDAYKNSPTNSDMICHAAKGMTCTVVSSITGHWQCMCTNWNAKKQHTTIDVYCQGP